jgi:hypothetical protein
MRAAPTAGIAEDRQVQAGVAHQHDRHRGGPTP